MQTVFSRKEQNANPEDDNRLDDARLYSTDSGHRDYLMSRDMSIGWEIQVLLEKATALPMSAVASFVCRAFFLP